MRQDTGRNRLGSNCVHRDIMGVTKPGRYKSYRFCFKSQMRRPDSDWQPQTLVYPNVGRLMDEAE